MAKISTPAIEKFAKKKQNATVAISTPSKDAVRRLMKNKLAVFGMVVILILILMGIFADFIAPYSYETQNYNEILQPPSMEHIMGTDGLGRDIFTRIIYGIRVSLPIGLICALTSLIVGGVIGVIAAFYGGVFEELVMRMCDVLQAIPPMLLAIAILAALGNGIGNMILANTVALIPLYARISRAAIYTVRGNEYVEAARAIGASSFRVMFSHLLPNAAGVIIITTTFNMAGCILVVSGLSYLGLGITAPTPEWGAMLSDAREYITKAPHCIIYPGLMIMITVFAINLFGDGLRDALDPKMK